MEPDFAVVQLFDEFDETFETAAGDHRPGPDRQPEGRSQLVYSNGERMDESS
ncbi:MAG: hypothetical protein ACLP8S_26515 [Solirubrobacteraceae bacterium]